MVRPASPRDRGPAGPDAREPAARLISQMYEQYNHTAGKQSLLNLESKTHKTESKKAKSELNYLFSSI